MLFKIEEQINRTEQAHTSTARNRRILLQVLELLLNPLQRHCNQALPFYSTTKTEIKTTAKQPKTYKFPSVHQNPNTKPTNPIKDFRLACQRFRHYQEKKFKTSPVRHEIKKKIHHRVGNRRRIKRETNRSMEMKKKEIEDERLKKVARSTNLVRRSWGASSGGVVGFGAYLQIVANG